VGDRERALRSTSLMTSYFSVVFFYVWISWARAIAHPMLIPFALKTLGPCTRVKGGLMYVWERKGAGEHSICDVNLDIYFSFSSDPLYLFWIGKRKRKRKRTFCVRIYIFGFFSFLGQTLRLSIREVVAAGLSCVQRAGFADLSLLRSLLILLPIE